MDNNKNFAIESMYKKRLTIYLTYDKHQVIDDYIGKMLQELRKVSTTLLVVCNETDVSYGLEYVKKYADKYVLRENKGFDAGGFKDALIEFVGWGNVEKYDEIVLCNDSFFGPFSSIEELFEIADSKEGDFWGLIKHGKAQTSFRTIPEHIQSFFIAIRRKMFASNEFQDYWNSMPYYETFNDVIDNHEIKFTKHFHDLGYNYFTLANTEINDSPNPKYNQNQYSIFQYELIKKGGFPFLKKQELGKDISSDYTPENIHLALEYIDTETEYDVGLIYRSLVRTMDLRMLQRNLNLNFIIDESAGDTSIDDAVIILLASNISAVDVETDTLNELKGNIEIVVLSKDAEVGKIYEDRGFEWIQSNDLLDTLKKFKEKKYICILPDIDISGQNQYVSTNKSTLYNYNENLIKNVGYCNAVKKLFEEKEFIGALIPPALLHSSNFMDIRWDGRDTEREIEAEINTLDLRCVYSEKIRPLTNKNCLWIRGEVIEHFIDRWERNSIVHIENIWQYLVQDAGFMMGQIQSKRYATMYQNYMQRYLSIAADQVMGTEVQTDHFGGVIKSLFIVKYNEFAQKYSKIYIYGTGLKATEYGNSFYSADGYVVSDGHRKQNEFNGKKVYEISELESDEQTGIVLCVDSFYQKEICNTLRKKGFENYICV